MIISVVKLSAHIDPLVKKKSENMERGGMSIKHETTVPWLTQWVEKAMPEGFTVLGFPAAYLRRVAGINLLERLNEELRRRTPVARLCTTASAILCPMMRIRSADN
jgi:transposase-like protein